MLEIKIATSNDAFDGILNRNYELCRLLEQISADIMQCKEQGVLNDINGNKVGAWKIGEDYE